MNSFYPFWIRYREVPSTFYKTDVTMSDFSDSELRDTVPDLPDPIVQQWHSTPDDIPSTPPATPRHNLSAAAALQNTPLKSSAIGSVIGEDGIIENEAIKRYVREHFRDKVHRGLSVHDFVNAVWGFKPDNIPVLRGMRSYSLKLSSLNMYLQCGWERSSYKHLVSVLEHLRKQVLIGNSPLSRKHQTELDDEYRCEPEFCLLKDCWVRGNYTVPLKPDLGWGTPKGNRRRRWEWYLGFIEVKKEKQEPIKHDRDVLISTAAFHEHKEASGCTAKQSRISTGSPQTARLAALSANTKRKGPPPAGEDIEPPAKRSRSNVDTAAAHIDAKLDPSTQPVLTGDEVQTAKYMNELLSHGVRSYATGLMIRNTTVTLWYGDRMGLVQTEAFDFKKEPHMLLLVIAAMESANHTRMGICPFLKFPSSTYDSYDGVTLELDQGLAVDATGKSLTKLVFQIDQKRSVITDFGAIGRGTTIVPVNAKGNAAKLFGQGELVAKMAWPSASRAAEDNFVRVIRRKLEDKMPKYLKHIVDMKCSITRTINQMSLPRAHMEDLIAYEKRVFRIIIMKKYEVLQMVDSVDEFKMVFIDVVRAHHYVWGVADVLHRDISANNIMFYRDEKNCPVGVLCDWDLAMSKPTPERYLQDDEENEENENKMLDKLLSTSRVPQNTVSTSSKHVDEHPPQVKGGDKENIEEGESARTDAKVDNTSEDPFQRPKYRTGTGPFMAMDLLSTGDAPLHRYRHDLESFFFVLAWVCAVFDPVNHKFGHLSEWEVANLKAIGQNKASFLKQRKLYESTFARSHPDYRALVDEWVDPLYFLFNRTIRLSDTIDGLRMDRLYAKKADDRSLKSSVDEETAQMKARRHDLVTYEKFLQCLKVPNELW